MEEKRMGFNQKPQDEAWRSLDIILNGRSRLKNGIAERPVCTKTQRVEDYASGRMDVVSCALMMLHIGRCASCAALLEHIGYDRAALMERMKGARVHVPAFAAASVLGAVEVTASCSAAEVELSGGGDPFGAKIVKTRLNDGIHWRLKITLSDISKARRPQITLAKSADDEGIVSFHADEGCELDIILVSGAYIITISDAQGLERIILELE